MVDVARSTIIDAPIEEVWRVFRDFNGHDRWHPAVKQSELERNKSTDQIGAVRNFVLTSGERVREQLLSLSDNDYSFRYCIVESDIPLRDYVADVKLKPVTDGQRTFCAWRSRFTTPAGRERELESLIADGVQKAGFEAIRKRVGRVGSRKTMYAPAHGATTPVLSGVDSTRTSLPPRVPVSGAMNATSIVIDRYGNADELRVAQTVVSAPTHSEVTIRQTVVGVNFIDVYCRRGQFELLKPPGVLGMEAAGVVVDVGSEVRHLHPGQRVVYACAPVGAYTSMRTMAADLVTPIPEDIDDETAAGGFLKGLTAEFLLHDVHALKRGQTALVFAPAGGVGRLLCQWAKHLGAQVIGATSNEAKARIARAAGADHVLVPGKLSLQEQVRDVTDGAGADVIFDAVGKDSFAHSIDALATPGHLVSFGQASGPIGQWDIDALASSSATISRPNFGHYAGTRQQVMHRSERLFDALRRRIITVDIGQRMALEDAREMHKALERGETTGANVLLVDNEK